MRSWFHFLSFTFFICRIYCVWILLCLYILFTSERHLNLFLYRFVFRDSSLLGWQSNSLQANDWIAWEADTCEGFCLVVAFYDFLYDFCPRPFQSDYQHISDYHVHLLQHSNFCKCLRYSISMEAQWPSG